jgi:hypothetical protein
MRSAYQPCTKHSKTYCSDPTCKQEEYGSSSSHTDNAGSISVTTDGGIGLGIGGGLAIDLSNGEIGVQFGGITID